ncbi:FAD-binding protein, partial [Corynebacterium stationis]
MATTTNQAETTADVLVIGFGKAGKTIAMNRAEHGDRVILVEQSP